MRDVVDRLADKVAVKAVSMAEFHALIGNGCPEGDIFGSTNKTFDSKPT